MEKSLKIKLSGKVLFPKNEEGRKSYFLVLDDQEQQRLVKELAKVSKLEAPIKDADYHEDVVSGINVKTVYDVPVFDVMTKEKIDTEIFANAKVTMSLNLKEYEYRKRKGITCYINAILLHENGNAPSKDITSFFDDDDLIQF